MDESERVSVIIPVYNCGEYLDKCLSSVMAQAYQNLDVIVINDGSTDNSGEIIRKYADRYANVSVMEQENRGVSAARNKGVENAVGEYLLFLDGDDYIGENYVKALVEAAQANVSDLVICGCTMVDTEGKVIQELIPETYKREEQEEWAYRLASAWSHLYRRKVWTDAGVKFAEGVRGEDLPITLFFNYSCTSIVVIPEKGYYYVQHQDSAMGNFRGLQSFRLPMEAIGEVLERLTHIKQGNSRAFLEYGVIKVFAMFLLDLGRGARWKVLRELCKETEDMIHRYFPFYRKNVMFRWNSHINMPFTVKGAVWFLVKLLNLHMLRPFMWIYSGATRRMGGKRR